MRRIGCMNEASERLYAISFVYPANFNLLDYADPIDLAIGNQLCRYKSMSAACRQIDRHCLLLMAAIALARKLFSYLAQPTGHQPL